MKRGVNMLKELLTKMIIVLESTGFAIIIFFLWANEILDLPHLLFDCPSTPVNWAESIFETVIVLFLGLYVIFATYSLLGEIKELEGCPSVCSECKKIKVGDKWLSFESHVDIVSKDSASGDICPECRSKMTEE